MESYSKKFHFQEIDWVICFSADGNSGKYRTYKVLLVERKNGKFSDGKQSRLGEILDRNEVEYGYPHTVGYFRTGNAQQENFKPEYLEIRGINTIEEFWAFLNAINL